MWKKEDATPEPMPVAPPRPAEPVLGPVRVVPSSSPSTGERATIGRSITIRGEVTGDEDLLIQGRIEGAVDLKQHSVTVGHEGQVKADIIGRVITIEGRVEGNLRADEQVVLRSSAQVQGDIVAPRVVLEDGARFRGGVDMGEMVQKPAAKAPPAATPAKSETGTFPELEKSGAPAGKGNGGAQKQPGVPA